MRLNLFALLVALIGPVGSGKTTMGIRLNERHFPFGIVDRNIPARFLPFTYEPSMPSSPTTPLSSSSSSSSPSTSSVLNNVRYSICVLDGFTDQQTSSLLNTDPPHILEPIVDDTEDDEGKESKALTPLADASQAATETKLRTIAIRSRVAAETAADRLAATVPAPAATAAGGAVVVAPAVPLSPSPPPTHIGTWRINTPVDVYLLCWNMDATQPLSLDVIERDWISRLNGTPFVLVTTMCDLRDRPINGSSPSIDGKSMANALRSHHCVGYAECSALEGK
jgi:hypothetical protein